jgi:hypothetical protein
MIQRSLLFVLPGLLCAHSAGAQVDGFNKGKGNMDLVLSLGYEQGLSYYLASGTADVQRSLASVSLFAARGLTKELDVQLSVPYVSWGGLSTIQDGQAFVKWLPLSARCAKGTLTAGAAAGGSMPLSEYPTGGYGVRASTFLPMGVVQYRWDEGTFVSLIGGHAFAEGRSPDAVVGTLRAGRATAAYYGEVYLQVQETSGGRDLRLGDEGALSASNDLAIDFVRLGAKYYHPFGKRFGWVIGAAYNLAGRNVDRSVMGAGSFIVHFRK